MHGALIVHLTLVVKALPVLSIYSLQYDNDQVFFTYLLSIAKYASTAIFDIKIKICLFRYGVKSENWRTYTCHLSGLYWQAGKFHFPIHSKSKLSSKINHKATQNAKQSIDYGTKIVGGVTPGKNGEHLGLPLLPSVRAVSHVFSSFLFLVAKTKALIASQAKDQLRPDATAIYVAAHQARTAISEAIEAEIPLIVAVAEHIPLHDMLRVLTRPFFIILLELNVSRFNQC